MEEACDEINDGSDEPARTPFFLLEFGQFFICQGPGLFLFFRIRDSSLLSVMVPHSADIC